MSRRCLFLIITGRRMLSTRLAEVGVFEAKKEFGQYSVGQLFLHRVFGYRGVVLFPWLAQVFDRDQPMKLPSSKSSNNAREVKGVPHAFYQCLIDSRDCPFIRAQTESVTFLGSRESGRALYAIPGLDYVAHEDVLPYVTSESPPLRHELFDKFFSYENVSSSSEEPTPPSLQQRETLRAWQERNRTWLELSDVHRETTEGIRVTVIPFYMGAREMSGSSVFWWRYLIRLENLTQIPVQLQERHWRIFSLSGTLETVQGRGVVGQEPTLSPSQPAFQYTSHISLQSPSGHMWGTFKMERLANSGQPSFFDCRIPPFSLESREPYPPPPSSTSPSSTKPNNTGPANSSGAKNNNSSGSGVSGNSSCSSDLPNTSGEV